MQVLHSANNSADPLATACAAQLLEVVPAAMRRIRAYMRQQRIADLTVPQFRALGFIGRHPETSVSAVADHLGLSVAAASRLIDALVERGLVERETSRADRRFVILRLSPTGAWSLAASREHAAHELAALLGDLTTDE